MSETAITRTAGLLVLLVCASAAADDLGDPTRPNHLSAKPAHESAPRAPSWHVESIIVSPGRRLAVINGRTVGINDRVDAARVVEILPYEVRLEYQGEVRRVSLVPIRVKRPANR